MESDKDKMEKMHIENRQIQEGVRPLYEEYIGSAYQELTNLSRREGAETLLVRHKASGRIAVKKRVSMECAGIYQVLRELNHPNITHIYEICRGQTDCVVVEEFVSGETLETRLQDGPLPEEEVVKYALQILDVLQEIHKRNIIHRDITPANVLISSDDVIRLIDFDIARSKKENQLKDTSILGTVGYAAPEQFGFCQTDITTDLYALGVLINVMLTGKLPDEGITEHKKLGRIVRKCIQIDPANRYGSAAHMRQELAGGFISTHQENKDASIFPGFRSDIRWKKNVAITGYVVMVLYTIGSISEATSDAAALMVETGALFLLWLAFFVGSNFARWDRRLFPFTRIPGKYKVTLRIILCFIIFYAGVLADNYAKYEILHLPKSGG